MKKNIYIGVIGTNGAGKTEICNFLSTRGFSIYSLSDIVRAEAVKKNLEPNRDNLVHIGTMLKSRLGDNILAKEVYAKAAKEEKNLAVFDSIRHIKEVAFLKTKNIKFIGIDAPVEIRYERIKKRKKDTDNIDFETFKKHDERENLGKSAGQNILEALKECDSLIINDRSTEYLHEQVISLLDLM
ncbi:MAG: AAA family ATPase [bacterium]|nr:AAA family ATPase [bacterium]